MLDRRRLITFFVITALLSQDMAMAIAPRSMFVAPVGTKVGIDQSPVPEVIVVEFIGWLKGEGAVIEDGENGLKVLKNLGSINFKKFVKDGYTIKGIRNAIIFVYNEVTSDAYILRDNEGNRYVTERFYGHYIQAPEKVKIQELLHEAFEYMWNKGSDDIDTLWDEIFRMMEGFGRRIRDEERDIYRSVFTKTNIENLQIQPPSNTAHILAELCEKLATLIGAFIADGSDIGRLRGLSLTNVDEEVKLSDLDQFISRLESLPLLQALERCLDRLLEGKTIEPDPSIIEYISGYKSSQRDAALELGFIETVIFLQRWHSGKYTSISEKDLGSIVERIVNTWLEVYKGIAIKLRKDQDDPVTIHYAGWHNTCKVKGILIRDKKCFISLKILNRDMGIIVPLREEGEIQPALSKDSMFNDVRYDRYLVLKLKVLLKAKQEPDLIGCIQEMIDTLGWETMVKVIMKNKDFLELTDEEIGELIGERKDLGLIGPYPQGELLEYTPGIQPSIHITGEIEKDILDETIAVLEDTARKIPGLKETLIDSLIGRIRIGRVLFGKHFTKACIAVEAVGEEGVEHLILVNRYLEDALSLDSGDIDVRSIRGIFLAGILLGQEAQIYLRKNKGFNWQEPDFNSAFIAQAAELQIIHLYRNSKESMRRYILYLESLTSNSWCDVNLADTITLHSAILSEGVDYQFIEARVDAIFIYRDVLKYLAQIEFSDESYRRADIFKLQELMKDIGLGVVLNLSDIPPPEVPYVSVQYKKRVDREELIPEEELISLVKNIHIPILYGKEHMLKAIGELVDNGIFSGIVIEVEPSIRNVKVRLDIRSMQITVTVPELRDKDRWPEYCETVEIIPGEKVSVVQTSIYGDFLKESAMNQRAIEEAHEVFQKGDIDRAERIIRRRLSISPKAFELYSYLIQLILPNTGRVKEAMELLHSLLRDHRLYRRSRRELLLRFIGIGLSIETLRNFSGGSNSVMDMLHLADIAKRYTDIHLREMETEKLQIRAKRDNYIAKLVMETDKSKRALINDQIEMLDNSLAESENEERRLKESFDKIASGIAFLCFDRSYYTAVDYWLDQTFKEDNERRQKRLLTKALLSSCGGKHLTEEELQDLFRMYSDRQKENPIDCANLASWAFHLYILWRYVYPERRELLEEAERRYEQYNAIHYISNVHVLQYAYYPGLIKYHLGKKDEALSYLGEFLTTAPHSLVVRLGCIEGKSIYAKLEGERSEKEGEKGFKDRKIRKIPAPVIVDLLENYFNPFINKGFSGLKGEDRDRFVYIYLKMLRECGELEKGFEQAVQWLETLPDVDIDMVEELVRIGVQLKKDDEVREILQDGLSSSRDKDIILDYSQVIAFKENNDNINALRLLNSIIQKYSSWLQEDMDRRRDKISANIFNERADIYMQMGQFTLAKKDWEYIKKKHWRGESVCQKYISIAEKSDGYYVQLVKSVFGDVEQNPDLVIKRMDEILERYPHYRLALRLRNTVRSYRGEFNEVEEEYRQLLEIYPDDIGFRLDLAFCSLMAESPKAVGYYREYQRLGGDIEPVRDQVASAYFNAKMWKEAIGHIKACIKKGMKSIDLDIKLAFSYVKLEMWEEAISVLVKDFPEENAAAQSKTTREQVSELFLACGFSLLKRDKLDWERIEILRKRASVWAEGTEMDGQIKRLEDEIEYLKLLEAEKETVREREKTVKLLMGTLRNRVNELREGVIEEDRLVKLQGEIEKLIAKIEELKDESIGREIEEIKRGLPGYLESARLRIRERNTAIDRLKEEIRTAIDALTSGKEVPEVTISNLFSRAGALGIQERLLDDLKVARDLAIEERKRKERERRLRELEVKVVQLEGEVNGMIEELQDLPPGMDPAPILGRYRDKLKGFPEKDLPEEIVSRLTALDNRFMGRYGQAKGRKNLKVKQAFDAEIEVALREMENIDIPRDGGVIERRGVIRRQLLRLVERVIEKYSRIQGFEIKQGTRRRVRRLAEEKIAKIINRLEEKMELKDEKEAKRRTEDEQARIDELFRRKQIIRGVIDEWAGMIREEIAEKARSEVDFDLIRLKGRQLAERLEGEGIYLTYEEAFHIQNEIFRIINPQPTRARFSWETIWPVLLAISMSERDRQRAQSEVEDCFKRPEIDDIDRRIFDILNGDGIMEKMQAANNRVRDTRNWSIKLGSTSELMRLGIISSPIELVMVQIHLLRGIYTDDPENHIDSKSPDYAVQVAETIARKFSSSNKQDFLYDLERTRLKLVPRSKPPDDREADEDEDTSWIRRNLGVHRLLTPDETRGLILLAQKGNPIAMNILQQAHAVTILNEAMNFAKRTNSHNKSGDYLNYGFLGFSQGVLRYGYRIGDKGEYIREEKWFRLHLINPNFLTWVRMPVKKSIERSAKKEAGDVTEAFWIEGEKRLLGRARGQVYRDINIIKGLSGLIEKREDEIYLTKKNITSDTVQRIALSTGMKPLEVLALLVDCSIDDLNKDSQGLLAKRLGAKQKSLELIAQYVGGEPIPEMVKGFELEVIRTHMDRVFEEILKEKNKDWRKQDSHNLGSLINVLLGREKLGNVWWLERRGLDERDLLDTYTEYFKRLYNLILENREDIAPVVEHMIEIPPNNQLNIDAKGISEIRSLDAPVSEDSDTERAEIEDLAGFVDQRSPLEELETQETPTAIDIRGLSPEAFMATREKVIAMLDRLGERLMGERRKELEEIRPSWEKELARLEEHRSMVAEIEEKLERARQEKLKELEPINRRMEEIEKRHEARKRGLLERQERERGELLERHRQELGSSRHGKGLETEERRAHWLDLQRGVVERINGKEAEIERAYKKTLGDIEDKARLDSSVALKFFDEAKDELDGEIGQLRSRHNVEISSAQSKEGPKEMEGFYPPIYPGIRSEIGTVKFSREFWELILGRVDMQSPEELLSELEGEKAEILRQLIEKARSFVLSPVELICTVYIPLCLDRRLWDLIDREGLELRDLLLRLNLIKKGQRPEMAHEYRIEEVDIFIPQLVILNRIVERYKRFLKRPLQPIVNLEAIRERQRRELEAIQRKVNAQKRLARIRYNGMLRQIEIEKGNAIREAEGRHDSVLAVLAEERKAGIREAGRQHKEWCRLSGVDRLTGKHKEELEQMERRHPDEGEALNAECEAEIAPIRQRYEALIADLDRGIGMELEELAEAIRYEEKAEEDMRHDLDRVSLAIAEERQALLDGNTEEDRELSERHQAEWEEFVDLVNSLGIGVLLLNGYPQWTEEIVRRGLQVLRGMEDSLRDVDSIASRQAEEERQLREKHMRQVEELDRREAERKRQLEEKRDELVRMRGRLFNSERYLSQYLDEELILLRKLERDFGPLDRRYQELEQRLKNFDRAKSIYLDYMGLSSTALESDGPMTLEIIGNDPRYRKPDGTPLTRERVRQIIKKLQLQLLVFDDLDDVDLELVDFYEKKKDIQKLSLRLDMDSFTDGKTDDLGRFFISRKELLRLLRSIIEDTDVAGTCADIIRLFIIKNQMPDVDTYRIVAEMVQQLIDATEPDEVTLLCFRECIGEMRIRLLRESQMGSPEKNLKPYTENAIIDLEGRFSDDYNPPDDFPYFPTTDKAWLSRDEIIRLGLTMGTNPRARELLDRFIVAQLEMYPDSGIEEVVKELTGIEIQPVSPGLIGKYVLTSRIEFIDGYIRFRAYHINDTKRQEIEIRIGAEKIDPSLFNNFRRTGIQEIDTALGNFLSGFNGEAFLLASNPYGIGGIGTRDTLAILKSLKDNDIALFHELAHAAGVDVTRYIRGGEDAINGYINKEGEGHRQISEMRQHYVLRLFQRQLWGREDEELTWGIKDERVRNLIKTGLDESKRSRILDGDDASLRLRLFTQVYEYLGRRFNLDTKVAAQRKRLLDISYQVAIRGKGSWLIAQRVVRFLERQMGFDLGGISYGLKTKLLTIVYGIGQGKGPVYGYWLGFLRRIKRQFGIGSFKAIRDKERQRLLTAVYYVARGKEKNEIRFNSTIEYIKEIFGITTEELSKKKEDGGLELGEKLRLITAAYAVSLARDGLNTFVATIEKIKIIFGITTEELSKKKEEGGLELGEKLRLITAAYHVSLAKDGLNTFVATIEKIKIIFGITTEELSKKKEEGGLELGEKLRLITAAYEVSLARDGLRKFIDSIHSFLETEEKKISEMSLSEKVDVITMAYSYLDLELRPSAEWIEVQGGLIGKYVLTSRIEFIDGYIRFRAYHINDTKRQEIEIRIGAEKIDPSLFNNFRRTGIQEIDTALEKFTAGFKGGAYLLSSNQYGIDGIGTRDTLAILKSLKDNDIALFHELAHAGGIDVTKYIDAGRAELYLYLRSKGPQMSQHYAIRLFQRQKWKADDRALTRLIKIDRLKTERDKRRRIEIAKKLGLDIRLTESGLLGVQFVGHDMAVKDIVNPNNEHKVAVYGCSGSDWSNFILSTNTDEAYFINDIRPDVGKLREILDRSWDTLNPSPYLSYKYRFGYTPSGEEGIPQFEDKILFELKLMGVKRDTITIISNQDGSFTISFEWAYRGQATKRYSITYIQADIARPKDYSDRLKKVLQKGIDIYYQKASIDLPGMYFEFMNVIANSVKEGGYILTDDIDFCVSRVDKSDLDGLLNEYRELSFTKKGEVYSEELRHWEELIQLLDPIEGKNLYYGSYVNIRQKKKSDIRKGIEKDIELLKGLWLREFNENLTYEVKYDVSRLSGSQQEIIKTYIDILRKKLNIVAKPFKGAKRDYVLKVICKNDSGKVFGEGGVDIEGEGNLEDSPLRIIGMLNIAFAASNIIDEPRVDDPLIRFIQYQYKAITGKELSEGADIRRIILPLPERIDIKEADRLNQLARELLVAA